MCSALRRGGFETLIATTDADGDGRLAVELGRSVEFNDVPAIFFTRQWSEALKYSRPLERWLHEHVADFDVVHIHAVFSHACLAAANACRKRGIPYVVRPLGTLDPWSLGQKSLRKRVFWRLGVKRMLDGAAAIHYTAEPEQKLAEASLGLRRGVVIPLGVEMDLSNGAGEAKQNGQFPEFLKQSPYVLVLSRLHPKKGLDLLLPAFLSLVKRREFARWKLLLAGDGDAGYVKSLRTLVGSEGGEDNVIFAGWLDGEKKRAALKGAAVLALTSYQENFGICAVEALACGVPVIVSPQVNLAREIETAGAGWVAPLEQSALEQTLADVLSADEARAHRGVAGSELVRRKFSWLVIADQLALVYEASMRNALARTS